MNIAEEVEEIKGEVVILLERLKAVFYRLDELQAELEAEDFHDV